MCNCVLTMYVNFLQKFSSSIFFETVKVLFQRTFIQYIKLIISTKSKSELGIYVYMYISFLIPFSKRVTQIKTLSTFSAHSVLFLLTKTVCLLNSNMVMFYCTYNKRNNYMAD